jgi:hypothetical protein
VYISRRNNANEQYTEIKQISYGAVCLNAQSCVSGSTGDVRRESVSLYLKMAAELPKTPQAVLISA